MQRFGLVLLALGLGACGARSDAIERLQPVPEPADPTEVAVSIDYHRAPGEIRVEATRPVYVAVFSLRERDGAWLLYPREYGADDRVSPSSPLAIGPRYTEGLPRAQVARASEIQPLPSGEYPVDYGGGHPRASTPTYLYVVASTEPLRSEGLLRGDPCAASAVPGLEASRSPSSRISWPDWYSPSTAPLSGRQARRWSGSPACLPASGESENRWREAGRGSTTEEEESRRRPSNVEPRPPT